MGQFYVNLSDRLVSLQSLFFGINGFIYICGLPISSSIGILRSISPEKSKFDQTKMLGLQLPRGMLSVSENTRVLGCPAYNHLLGAVLRTTTNCGQIGSIVLR